MTVSFMSLEQLCQLASQSVDFSIAFTNLILLTAKERTDGHVENVMVISPVWPDRGIK